MSEKAGFVRLAQLRKLRACEQVAAVCYRVRGGRIEFLLVQTRGSGRWIFPKGSAEPGLTHAQAAALEAYEEAGVHGRIEETAFTQYVRCAVRKIAVAAHLCEVSRLGPPQEAKRNRTWFSAADTRQCLRDGRGREDGAALARVIDRAVARIKKVRRSVGELQPELLQTNRRYAAEKNSRQRDPLHEVRFDFEEGYGRLDVDSAVRKLGGMRQAVLPAFEARGKVLRGEVLEFALPRSVKAKALGAGISVRG